MKKIVLTFLMLFTFVTSSVSQGSGSTTVYLPKTDYVLSNVGRELADFPELFDLLESVVSKVYFARVSSDAYDCLSRTIAQDSSISIQFEGYEEVTFHYNPILRIIIGINSKQEALILTH